MSPPHGGTTISTVNNVQWPYIYMHVHMYIYLYIHLYTYTGISTDILNCHLHPVQSPYASPFIPFYNIQTCMCLFVHGCFNCLSPKCTYMPFTTEWPIFGYFSTLSGSHRVAEHWVSMQQPSKLKILWIKRKKYEDCWKSKGDKMF